MCQEIGNQNNEINQGTQGYQGLLYSSKCAIKSVAWAVQQKTCESIIWLICTARLSRSHQHQCAVTVMRSRELMLDVPHCFLLLGFVLFFSFLHLISVSFCGLASLHLEKKKKTDKRENPAGMFYIL